ncbi:fatty acid desaturase [Paenibacillus qinlingensis]|uniref:fatty acid desaturase n=1 Tax=Paenibacillus qinlingensis TaxID=1837343 RepID=UPI0015637133|nr:fatty acid desaturase [Paenibacillus qinlingensis]NQX58096.1 fatty acid desaturase [Paenibacillus qinlingensis]
MTQSTLTNLKKQVAPYEKSNTRASTKQLLNTLGPLFLLWVAAYLSLSISYWMTLPITIIASGFVIRTFIIFHDCCHQSFFKSRRANEIVGTITGILTLFPYQQWKNSHSIHHATSSNLEKRGIGDMWVLTVDEYAASSIWVRMAYRLYRNPFIMFGLGPIFLFLFTNRFNTKGARRKERISTYMTNVSILALYGLLIWMVGWQSFVLIQAPIMFVAGLMGIWLFYVQHQFEDSYFEKEDEWSYVKAAVEGSSYYKLPKLLQWITGNIGFHHVHHLSPKVPNYNLEKAHNATPPLQKATTITIGTSLKSLSFKLWDERNKTFVGYKNNKQVNLKENENDSAAAKIKVEVRKSSFQGQ